MTDWLGNRSWFWTRSKCDRSMKKLIVIWDGCARLDDEDQQTTRILINQLRPPALFCLIWSRGKRMFRPKNKSKLLKILRLLRLFQKPACRANWISAVVCPMHIKVICCNLTPTFGYSDEQRDHYPRYTWNRKGWKSINREKNCGHGRRRIDSSEFIDSSDSRRRWRH